MPQPEKPKAASHKQNARVVSALTASRRHLTLDQLLREANTSPTLLAGFVAEDTDKAKAVLHHQVSVVEFASPALLEEVLRATPLPNYVVRKLGEQAVIIDQDSQDQIIRFLTNLGYEPRVVAG